MLFCTHTDNRTLERLGIFHLPSLTKLALVNPWFSDLPGLCQWIRGVEVVSETMKDTPHKCRHWIGSLVKSCTTLLLSICCGMRPEANILDTEGLRTRLFRPRLTRWCLSATFLMQTRLGRPAPRVAARDNVGFSEEPV
jgi:hypothetical protein